MAGAGYKLFNTGDVLLASEVNTYLQQQVTMVFANAAARTTALSGVLAEGMMSYLQDTNTVEVYNGTSWVNVGNAGDITEVQAGTGISVASGTGPIPVVTSTVATTFDAKGDLVVGTGADTFAKLSVGTNGHTLVADSAETTGLKWQAPAAGSFVGCKLTKSVGQNCNNNTDVTVSWDQEEFDTDGFHDNSVNNTRVTIPSGKGGKYLFVVALSFEANTNGRRESRLFKNGNGTNTFFYQNAATSGKNLWISTNLLNLVAGDYIELQVMQTSGTNLDFMTESYFAVQYLGA
jgi:hypothetical protein